MPGAGLHRSVKYLAGLHLSLHGNMQKQAKRRRRKRRQAAPPCWRCCRCWARAGSCSACFAAGCAPCRPVFLQASASLVAARQCCVSTQCVSQQVLLAHLFIMCHIFKQMPCSFPSCAEERASEQRGLQTCIACWAHLPPRVGLGLGLNLAALQEAIEAFGRLSAGQYATGWVLSCVGRACFEAVDYPQVRPVSELQRPGEHRVAIIRLMRISHSLNASDKQIKW